MKVIYFFILFIPFFAFYQTPINDDPCNAILVPVDTVCNPVTYSNVGATPSALPMPLFCPSVNDSDDVWFKFQVPFSGRVSIIGQGVTGGINNTAIAVYKDTCNNLIEIGCDDDGGPSAHFWIYLDCLTPGDTMHFRIFNQSSFSGSFAFCVVDSGILIPPVLDIGTIDGEDTLCLNDVKKYSISKPISSGTFSYNWSVTNGKIIQGGGLADSTIDILWDSLTTAGHIQVVAQKAEKCSSNSDTANLSVYVICTASDVPTVVASSGTICYGCSDTLTVVNSTLGSCAQWVWYEGGTCNAPPIGYGSSIIVSPLQTTVYLVQAVDSIQQCGNTVCVPIFVTVLPTITNDLEYLSSLSIFPNPIQDRISIQFSSNPVGIVKMSVFDLCGRQVLSTFVNQKHASIPVDLAPGVYHLELSVNESRLSRRVLVE